MAKDKDDNEPTFIEVNSISEMEDIIAKLTGKQDTLSAWCGCTTFEQSLEFAKVDLIEILWRMKQHDVCPMRVFAELCAKHALMWNIMAKIAGASEVRERADAFLLSSDDLMSKTLNEIDDELDRRVEAEDDPA